MINRNIILIFQQDRFFVSFVAFNPKLDHSYAHFLEKHYLIYDHLHKEIILS